MISDTVYLVSTNYFPERPHPGRSPSEVLVMLFSLLLATLLVPTIASLQEAVVNIDSSDIRFLLLGDWGLYGASGSSYSFHKKSTEMMLQKKNKVLRPP